MEVLYKNDDSRFSELEKNVVLPTFQGKLVWSKAQKKSFINTLHEGFPFGSILVYRYPDADKLSLIDGLQRYSTIKDFKSNPQEYVPFDDINDKIYDLIISDDSTIPASTVNHYKLLINEALKETVASGTYAKASDGAKAIKNKFDGELDIASVMLDLVEIFESLKDTIDNYLDISQLSIPTITFTGEETQLATVFENLNRGGVKLSKYQVFAAQWSQYIIKLSEKENNKKLLNKTIEMYDKLTEDRDIKGTSNNYQLIHL